MIPSPRWCSELNQVSFIVCICRSIVGAEERKERSWQCKIGKTKGNPLDRILAQAGTVLPEKPIIALALRTKYSAALETALQGVLTLRGLAIEDAPGNEWFLTSPAEVLALAKVFDPHSYDVPSSSENVAKS